MSKPKASNVAIQIFTVVTLIFMLTMNVISMVAPFNNRTNANVSFSHETILTPAGAAFSIWSLIFLLLILYTGYRLWPKHHKNEDKRGFKVQLIMAVNFLLNGLWSVPFSYQIFWLSVIIIFSMLGTLIAAYLLSDNGVGFFSCSQPQYKEVTMKDSALKYWFVHFPISVYLGWISVASTVNMSIFLKFEVGWNPADPEPYGVVLLFVLALLTLASLVLKTDVAFASVIVWSLFWIGQKQTNYPQFRTISYILAFFLACCSIMALIRRMLIFRQYYNRQHPSLIK
eukprot:TRINITY_DN13100_c0_g1_i1.p1 TRINITY_DN13100_c0_g1~~TRINITY_DN13100_c0_g1_i1.p1  ORF type:complete len:285 (-),score=32.80 TRINITY_DN13100_c0_g1_i1:28-882(-)